MKKRKILLSILLFFVAIIAILGIIFVINKIINQNLSVKYMVDGEIYKEEIVKFNSTLNLETLEKDGFSFIGWYNGKKKYDNNTKIRKNTVLYAKWEEFSNYVIFDGNNGIITKVPVLYNSKVKEILKPAKAGYRFLGWYYNDTKFDFDKTITTNITLQAKWEKTDEKQEIDTNSYINAYINNSIQFNTAFDNINNKINVNLIGVNNKLSKVLDNIKNTSNMIVKRDDILKLNIKYNDKLYVINKNNIDMIDELFKDLTSTSDKNFQERTISSLYKKDIQVEFILNNDYYYSLTNNIYNISFTSDKIVSKEEMDNNSLKAVSYIKLYDVSFDSNTHYINCTYDKSYATKKISTVIYDNSHNGGGNGTGLNDAMQIFASNQNIFYLVIHMPDGTLKKISRDEIIHLNNSLSMLSFGNDIIAGMGINGKVTSVTHNEFTNKKIKLSVELLSGYAFEDGFNNEYILTINSQ